MADTRITHELAADAVGFSRLMGTNQEATLRELLQAIRVDPLMPEIFLHPLAQCHFDLGDYEEAARVLRQRITRRPNTDISRVRLAATLGLLGRHEEARHEWTRAKARSIPPIRSGRSARP